jgi:hypothetical protein
MGITGSSRDLGFYSSLHNSLKVGVAEDWRSRSILGK